VEMALDVSSGTGIVMQRILSAGLAKQALGTDLFPNMMEFTRAALPRDRARFVVGDVLKVGLPLILTLAVLSSNAFAAGISPQQGNATSNPPVIGSHNNFTTNATPAAISSPISTPTHLQRGRDLLSWSKYDDAIAMKWARFHPYIEALNRDNSGLFTILGLVVAVATLIIGIIASFLRSETRKQNRSRRSKFRLIPWFRKSRGPLPLTQRYFLNQEMPLFVGREAELAKMESLLGQAVRSSGTIILLTGERSNLFAGPQLHKIVY
jgi:hypothetical protein